MSISTVVDLVCFGELLWDVLPEDMIAGGAPFNLVNRATALGLNARVISSIGRDIMGDKLLQQVGQKGNNIDFIQRHPSLPTGIVNINIGLRGEPNYDIVRPVAWDDIILNDALIDLVKSSRSFVYSSLGLRSNKSQNTWFALVPYAKLKICDINLRKGHYSLSTILDMMGQADILRMNEDELTVICNWLDFENHDLESTLIKIQKKYGYDTIIITFGSKGVTSLRNGLLTHFHGYEVMVKDTVGSGDAFLAAYIHHRLKNYDEKGCLKFACAVGALNASKDGGTPEIGLDEIDKLLLTG